MKPFDRARERGFVMVALLIAMAVTAVWMATMLPAWRQQAIREKEENLVAYGNDYARALGHYYLKNNCTLPADVDALLSGHYLRRKWKDPITGKDFQPLMVGGATSSGGLGQQPQNLGPRAPGQQQQTPASPAGAAGANRGAQSAAPAGGAAPAGAAGGANQGRPNTPGTPTGQTGGGQQPLVGLSGVASESTATSIRLVNQAQQYNLWRFDYSSGLLMLGHQPGCQNGQPIGTNNGGQQGGRQNGDGRTAQPGAAGNGPRGPIQGGQGNIPTGGGPPPPGARVIKLPSP